MLKVFVDVFFRDMDLPGDILCRKGLVLQDGKDLMPDGVMPFNRNERFFGLEFFYHVFLCIRASLYRSERGGFCSAGWPIGMTAKGMTCSGILSSFLNPTTRSSRG